MAEETKVYATIEDLRVRMGKNFGEDRAKQAEALLLDANAMVAARNPRASDAICKAVVVSMVKRVLNTPYGMEGVKSGMISAGSFQEQFSFPTGYGDLRIMPSEEKQLGLRGQRLGYMFINTAYEV